MECSVQRATTVIHRTDLGPYRWFDWSCAARAERALGYRTLVLTGLRRGELSSLTLGSLKLDTPTPFSVLEAGNEKNGRES